jgi:hypothetical protein
MVEKDVTDLLLTDGAGGFLLGVLLGCLGMTDQDHIWGPGPLDGQSSKTGRGSQREARSRASRSKPTQDAASRSQSDKSAHYRA